MLSAKSIFKYQSKADKTCLITAKDLLLSYTENHKAEDQRVIRVQVVPQGKKPYISSHECSEVRPSSHLNDL